MALSLIYLILSCPLHQRIVWEFRLSKFEIKQAMGYYQEINAVRALLSVHENVQARAINEESLNRIFSPSSSVTAVDDTVKVASCVP